MIAPWGEYTDWVGTWVNFVGAINFMHFYLGDGYVSVHICKKILESKLKLSAHFILMLSLN